MEKILKEIENFIFDLDGTILNSSQEVLKCLELAYKETKTPYDKDKISSDVIGPPLKGIFKLISPEIKDGKTFDLLIEAYSSHYDHSKDDLSKMYDGMFEFLKKLNAKNKKLFIATNKPKTPTKRLLEQFNLDFFKDVYTIDKYDGREMSKQEMIAEIIDKYSLDKAKTAMIGDALHDSVSAKNNDIIAIGVLWGYGKEKDSLIEASNVVVKSTKELIDLI